MALKQQSDITLQKINEVLTAVDTKFGKVDTQITGLQTEFKTTGLMTSQLAHIARDLHKFSSVYYKQNGIEQKPGEDDDFE